MSDVVDLERAVELLARGGVVAVATDTVYGVAAALSQPAAVARLFTVKRRPTSVALPVVVDSVAMVEELAVTWPGLARRASGAFWPGALTIVVSAPEELATLVGAASATVGFRVPDHESLRNVVRRVGPLAVSSANEHGRPPCRTVDEVLDAFAGCADLDGVLDGGACHGAVSTVVAIDEDSWHVLRLGAVTEDALRRVLQ